MSEEIPGIALTEEFTNSQRLFVRYLVAVLIDLTVLNLFDEYWALVKIDPFSVSVLTAILLQVLLKVTLVLEHKVAVFFKARPGSFARFMRFFSAWLILFGSKFLMLGVLELAFGDDILFTGPLHGVVSFIVVILVMLAAEEIAVRFYRRLNRSA
ncbi:MAG: hypothetical protein OEV03_02115 [Gammaproteobacteria bacterium]|jgi:hypothetical protein|nr:hypothetical protein [Gammaproteobacteria bacterium]MDH3952976.1 hypothetical protein [Gammaproteobacteria bacterium]MDH4005658.1 hypothetical protein [Gammaproteobacteria bacterium]